MQPLLTATSLKGTAGRPSRCGGGTRKMSSSEAEHRSSSPGSDRSGFHDESNEI